MVHWRHRLYGVDAPAAWSSLLRGSGRQTHYALSLSAWKLSFLDMKMSMCAISLILFAQHTSISNETFVSLSPAIDLLLLHQHASPCAPTPPNFSSFMPASESVNYVASHLT